MGSQTSFAEYVRRQVLRLCGLLALECLIFTIIFAFSSTNPMYLLEQDRVLTIPNNVKVLIAMAAIAGLLGMLALTRSILCFIAASDRFVEVERLAVLGKFSVWAAHQIRNPLAVIDCQAQILLRKAQDESLKKAYTQIIKQSEKTSDLLSLMMALSQPVLLHKEPLKVCHIISEIVSLYAILYPEVTFLLTPADEGEILGHRGLLEEAFKNVIINAVESMDGMGRVEIVCTGDCDSVSIKVYDTGPGFSEDGLEDALEIGFTTKKYGNGLGLPIVKAIMNAHKGSVEVGRAKCDTFSTLVTLRFPVGAT